MIVGAEALETLDAGDLCVVGGGPVGLALALACEARGLPVVLLESGHDTPHPARTALSAGHGVDPSRHAEPAVAICRALGGTSRWWGGRCVPFDPTDFSPRPGLPDARWPWGWAEIEPWQAEAARFLGLDRDGFQAPAPGFAVPGLRTDTLERWAPTLNMATVHRDRLRTSRRLRVVTDATVTGLTLSPDGTRVASLEVSGASGRGRIAPGRVALACGGLETTRLLLAAQAAHLATAPGAFGGPEGALGRFYMGHLSGRIADIVLADPAAAATQDFFADGTHVARRRLTLPAAVLRQEGLRNIAFWLDNPAFHAAEHGSGVLSAVWLALAVPPLGRRLVSEAVRLSHRGPGPAPVWPHLRNLMRAPHRTLRDLGRILRARYGPLPRQPGFLLPSASGRYALHFHAEHAPTRASRVRLSGRRDPFGLPFLDIDLRFTPEDAADVVRAHDLLDAALRRSGQGMLAWHQAPEDRLGAVLAQARDGIHQIGTARMGRDPATSVADPDARVHGLDNLWLASSALFPSSGQANPTLLAVALALRLAGHLAGEDQGARTPSAVPAPALP